MDERIRDAGLELRQIEGQQVDDLLDEMAATLPLPLPDPEDVDRSLAHLVEPPVAYVVADESYGSDPVRSGTGLAVAAESLLALAARPSRGPLHWLRARGLEWSGDLAAAEGHLRTADRLDPDFYPLPSTWPGWRTIGVMPPPGSPCWPGCPRRCHRSSVRCWRNSVRNRPG